MPSKSNDDFELSPMMENTESTTKDNPNKSDSPKTNKYTYILIAIVAVLVLYLIYYAYTSFYVNQDTDECFIEKTVKTGTESDVEFDMDVEVSKLKRLQEKYLASLRHH